MVVPDLIYDIGLHIGNDTAFYLSEGFRVVAIEANPLLVEQCRHRFATELENGLLRILPLGIGEKSGTMPFYINPRNTEWSAFDKEVAWRDGQEGLVVDVDVVPLDDVVNNLGSPFFLKSDIETGDRFVLDAMERLPRENLPIYMSIEAHRLAYLARLHLMGYTEFKIVDQRAHGLYACSGPFGENTPGPWMDFETAAYEWLHWRMRHQERHTFLSIDPLTWHDFHAKRPG